MHVALPKCPTRCRAKRDFFWVQELEPESPGQGQVLTFLCVPHSLENGRRMPPRRVTANGRRMPPRRVTANTRDSAALGVPPRQDATNHTEPSPSSVELADVSRLKTWICATKGED